MADSTGRKPYTNVPAVPVRTPMFDAQGNLTRTWIIFFERILKAQQTIEQITNTTTTPNVITAASGNRTTFVLEDTNTDAEFVPLEQLTDIEIKFADIVCDPGNTDELEVDITVDGISIFGSGTKLVVPAGTPANHVVRQPIIANPKVRAGQIWNGSIVDGDGTALASVVLPWK